MSLSTPEQDKLDDAIDRLVNLREKLESRAHKSSASRIISILEDIASAHDKEVTLIDIYPDDGEMPDEEHMRLLEAFKLPESLDLTELNDNLRRCKRSARAELAPADDKDYDDDLDALSEAEEEAEQDEQ